jgi:hypothetical protein
MMTLSLYSNQGNFNGFVTSNLLEDAAINGDSTFLSSVSSSPVIAKPVGLQQSICYLQALKKIIMSRNLVMDCFAYARNDEKSCKKTVNELCNLYNNDVSLEGYFHYLPYIVY